jgi:hypothetical protein
MRKRKLQGPSVALEARASLRTVGSVMTSSLLATTAVVPPAAAAPGYSGMSQGGKVVKLSV